ncbi:MAG: hypothetical protein KDE31_36975 [Caldilineaceae bacterium]|nr:hypothetical protein [Caldilineaceae bacterium]
MNSSHISKRLAQFVAALAHKPYLIHNNIGSPFESDRGQHLLRQLYQGDAGAWRNVIEIWSPQLYHFLLYATYCEEDAQELLHHSFVDVAKAVTRGAFIPQSLSELTILIVTIVDRLVRAYQEEKGAPAWDESTLTVRFDAEQAAFLVALQQLAPAIRHLLLLRYLVNLPLYELSAVTGYSIANIRLIFRIAALHFVYYGK